MAGMNAVGWFDIYVDDLKRAVSFYESVLGAKLEPMGDPTDRELWSNDHSTCSGDACFLVCTILGREIHDGSAHSGSGMR